MSDMHIPSEEKNDTPQKSQSVLLLRKYSILIVILTIVVVFALVTYIWQLQKNSALTNNDKTSTTQTIQSSITDTQEKQIDDGRAKLEDFLQKYSSVNGFNPDTATPGPQFQTLSIKVGGKYRMKIDYGSVGDIKMDKASLFVQLGENLKIIPGTIKDDFKGQGPTQVKDSVYNVQSRNLVYGPGSIDKSTSKMDLTDQGSLTFDVQLDSEIKSGQMVRLYSYISQEGGSKGKIDLVFFKVI